MPCDRGRLRLCSLAANSCFLASLKSYGTDVFELLVFYPSHDVTLTEMHTCMHVHEPRHAGHQTALSEPRHHLALVGVMH